MAEHGAVDVGSAAGASLAERQHTYRGFLGLIKYSLAGIAIVLILMAIFLT